MRGKKSYFWRERKESIYVSKEREFVDKREILKKGILV